MLYEVITLKVFECVLNPVNSLLFFGFQIIGYSLTQNFLWFLQFSFSPIQIPSLEFSVWGLNVFENAIIFYFKYIMALVQKIPRFKSYNFV